LAIFEVLVNKAMMKQKRDEFVKGFEALEGIRKDVAVCFLKHLLNVIQTASRTPEEA
jgi:hypothetical protein